MTDADVRRRIRISVVFEDRVERFVLAWINGIAKADANTVRVYSGALEDDLDVLAWALDYRRPGKPSAKPGVQLERGDTMTQGTQQERETAVAALAGGPYPGQPATYSIGSDDWAYEVVEVRARGRIVVAAPAGPANSLTQQRAVHALPSGHEHVFTLRRDGRYRLRGQNSGYLYLGKAETRLDPSF